MIQKCSNAYEILKNLPVSMQLCLSSPEFSYSFPLLLVGEVQIHLPLYICERMLPLELVAPSYVV